MLKWWNRMVGYIRAIMLHRSVIRAGGQVHHIVRTDNNEYVMHVSTPNNQPLYSLSNSYNAMMLPAATHTIETSLQSRGSYTTSLATNIEDIVIAAVDGLFSDTGFAVSGYYEEAYSDGSRLVYVNIGTAL